MTVKSICEGRCSAVPFEDLNVCLACGRSITEISDWLIASDDRKLEIIQNAKQRMIKMANLMAEVRRYIWEMNNGHNDGYVTDAFRRELKEAQKLIEEALKKDKSTQ